MTLTRAGHATVLTSISVPTTVVVLLRMNEDILTAGVWSHFVR
jgi:hypothetical protein